MQETIIATRNAEVVTTNVNETRTVTQVIGQRREEEQPPQENDPLAQSFTVTV